jgi:hypothetical protein
MTALSLTKVNWFLCQHHNFPIINEVGNNSILAAVEDGVKIYLGAWEMTYRAFAKSIIIKFIYGFKLIWVHGHEIGI